jgi:phosphate transport system substrate-binding protein
VGTFSLAKGHSRAFAAAIALAAVVFVAGCGNQSEDKTSSSTAGGTVLNGAGATFPAPLYQKWFQEYQQKAGVSINYQPIGSGGGIKQITGKAVDFGASDAPMSDAELAKAPGIVHIPTVAGAVCVAYNVPGAPANLKLTGPVIADMFLGAITKWNDPKIAALNPGVTLPATTITPFHRSDGSGTTNIFTTYLQQVAPEWSKIGAGKSVNWPKGDGGKGNPGVAALIKQIPGGVGYIELAYAETNKIPFAQVQNQSGAFITPSVDSTTAAASGVTLPPDFRKVIVNTTAKDGYPITGFTFLLIYPDAKPQLKGFLKWALTDGGKDAPALYYAPLPDNVQKAALAKLDSLK